MQRGILGAVCGLVIGAYVSLAHSGHMELLSLNAAETYYNLLVRGFRAGHLGVERDVPPGLAQLADPYDPIANAPYRSPSCGTYDMSYFKGRLYLYFGVTPALMLFWPFAALTGHYLFHRQAVAIFCAVGYLASVYLLRALWRRYFPATSVWVVAACALALGLATGVPVLLSRSEVYEVPVSCGYMLVMLVLVAIWHALHSAQRKCQWLAVASVGYGLAVGARPSLLFGAVVLLVPVAQAWRERQRIGALLLAGTYPIALIGLGLMFYNYLRFEHPLEFGQRYQLTGDRLQADVQQFSLSYLWFNFRVYFSKSVGWSCHFPFVQKMGLPPLPAGHGGVEKPFGILANVPLVWLALAAPLAWWSQPADRGSTLCWFVTAVGLFFWVEALTIGLYVYTCSRYEVEFLPVALLLAAVGVLGLERALAERVTWRRAVRWIWGLLLSCSVAFNLFASVDNFAETHYNLGLVLWETGKTEQAIGQYKQALRIKPDYVDGHNNLGVALMRAGDLQSAMEQFEQSLRIEADNAEAHYNLGNALEVLGKHEEAISQYEQALRLKPGLAEAQSNLGVALTQSGRIPEAIAHYKQAVRLKPGFAETHYNLAVALERAGNVREAIANYEQALRIKPDYAEAQSGLARLLNNP